MSLCISKMSSRCYSPRKQGECECWALAEVGGGGSTGWSAKGIYSWII
jgi:hypothetical protein